MNQSPWIHAWLPAAMLALAACSTSPEVAAPADDAAPEQPATQGRLQGRVTQGGRPPTGVVVGLCKQAPAGTKNYYQPLNAVAMATVGDDGWYLFARPLAPGEYVLVVWEEWRLGWAGSSFAPPRLGLLPLSVAPGEPLSPVDIVLP